MKHYNSNTASVTLSLVPLVPKVTIDFGGSAANQARPASDAPESEASLLSSMARNRSEGAAPTPLIDKLGFFNGFHTHPEHEAMLREYTLASAKDEATSERFANAPYVDQDKVRVKPTDTAWALFRLFASDFAYHMVDERAYELATALRFNRDGLRRLADAFYGPMCGHNPDGDPVKIKLGDMWWRSTRSADVRNISNEVMEPTCDPDDHTSRVFNRYHILRRGAVSPDLTATRDDIKVFDDHLLMSAGGCEVSREFALDWMAHQYQCPGHKPSSAIAIVSPLEGTGKSWFLYPLKWIFGEGLVGSTGGAALYEVYDDPFIHKQLVFIDEIPDPEKNRHGADPIAKVNRMITSPKTTMRPLGKPAVEMRTPSVIIACNKVEYLVAVLTGRRLCILYNPDTIQDAAYYNMLFAWAGVDKPGPGMAKLAGYLANRDISKFNPNAEPPVTAGKALARAAALSKEARFFRTLYEEGHPLFAKDFGRALETLNQLDTLCPPAMLRGLSLGVNNLPKVFKELGWKQVGVDGSYQTANKAHRAWCWRNFEKWGDVNTKREERLAHLAGSPSLTVHHGGISQ